MISAHHDGTVSWSAVVVTNSNQQRPSSSGASDPQDFGANAQKRPDREEKDVGIANRWIYACMAC